jgi:hypothetical protein
MSDLKSAIETLSTMSLMRPTKDAPFDPKQLVQTVQSALEEIDRRLDELERKEGDARRATQFPTRS